MRIVFPTQWEHVAIRTDLGEEGELRPQFLIERALEPDALEKLACTIGLVSGDTLKQPRRDFVGDGYDTEPLLTAEDVGEILQVPTKSVYELPIPKVRISKRRVRYRPDDVNEFIEKRTSEP